MNIVLENINKSPIKLIAEKVLNNLRITTNDALVLYNSSDLLTIGALADHCRKNRTPEEFSNNTYFINNHHINITNICQGDCKFCAYRKNETDIDAYFMSIDDVENYITNKVSNTIKELHIVSAINKKASLEYYCKLFTLCKKLLPDAHIQALTAVEIDYLSTLEKATPEKVLEKLVKSGLGSLPGGGAEIFAEEIRQKVCPNKISGTRWLEIMEIAHKKEIKSNATMLTGIGETYQHRVDHLNKIRNLQDKTSGFMTFIPLFCHYENTELDYAENNTGFDNLKDLAISRIFLDNIPHIKSFWIQLGINLAQISLAFGVDDLDGTVVTEKISKAAGANSKNCMTKEKLIQLIKNANRIPVERDTVYNIIQTY